MIFWRRNKYWRCSIQGKDCSRFVWLQIRSQVSSVMVFLLRSSVETQGLTRKKYLANERDVKTDRYIAFLLLYLIWICILWLYIFSHKSWKYTGKIYRKYPISLRMREQSVAGLLFSLQRPVEEAMYVWASEITDSLLCVCARTVLTAYYAVSAHLYTVYYCVSVCLVIILHTSQKCCWCLPYSTAVVFHY